MMPQLKIPISMQSKKLYICTREHSRNSSLLCGINVKNGGMTKGFTSLDELVMHLYGKYGENWLKVCITEPGSYTVYDSPRDGSCMYHSVSVVLQPIMRERTPSAEGLKATLQVFYSQRGQLQQNMERLLTITFKDKLKDVCQEDPVLGRVHRCL